MPIIRQKVMPDSIGYTDGFGGYNALNISEFRHERIDHSSELVGRRSRHINGIENFRNQAKPVLRKYNSIPRANFELFLGADKRRLRLVKRWLTEDRVI